MTQTVHPSACARATSVPTSPAGPAAQTTTCSTRAPAMLSAYARTAVRRPPPATRRGHAARDGADERCTRRGRLRARPDPAVRDGARAGGPAAPGRGGVRPLGQDGGGGGSRGAAAAVL